MRGGHPASANVKRLQNPGDTALGFFQGHKSRPRKNRVGTTGLLDMEGGRLASAHESHRRKGLEHQGLVQPDWLADVCEKAVPVRQPLHAGKSVNLTSSAGSFKACASGSSSCQSSTVLRRIASGSYCVLTTSRTSKAEPSVMLLSSVANSAHTEKSGPSNSTSSTPSYGCCSCHYPPKFETLLSWPNSNRSDQGVA